MENLELTRGLFRGLGDRSRLNILSYLQEGPSRVNDIVEATGLAQANVSSHLSCLWECGLVSRQRQGREVHYQLVEGVDDLLTTAQQILTAAGDTLGACPNFGLEYATSDDLYP